MQQDIIDFLIQNKDDINQFLDSELHPTYLASRIFDGYPDLQQDILDAKRTQVLIRYLLEQFPDSNYLEINLNIPENYVIILAS